MIKDHYIFRDLIFIFQFTGQANVLYYAPTIFQSIGYTDNTAALLASVGLGVIKVRYCAMLFEKSEY